jgi:hypothetical protein
MGLEMGGCGASQGTHLARIGLATGTQIHWQTHHVRDASSLALPLCLETFLVDHLLLVMLALAGHLLLLEETDMVLVLLLLLLLQDVPRRRGHRGKLGHGAQAMVVFDGTEEDLGVACRGAGKGGLRAMIPVLLCKRRCPGQSIEGMLTLRGGLLGLQRLLGLLISRICVADEMGSEHNGLCDDLALWASGTVRVFLWGLVAQERRDIETPGHGGGRGRRSEPSTRYLHFNLSTRQLQRRTTIHLPPEDYIQI